MSYSFTKLFSSITESTIWIEPYPTRIVWVSMLAMADRQGRIWAAIPGLARRAGVTLDECEAALQRFLGPDKYSRTSDNEGRRIETIEGGWRLLNYAKYRAIRDEEARKDYRRVWDQTKRKPRKSDKSDNTRPAPTQAEAEAEASPSLRSGESARSPEGGSSIPAAFGLSAAVIEWARQKGYGDLDKHLERFRLKALAKNYCYTDWDAALMGAIEDDWAGLRSARGTGNAVDAWWTSDNGIQRKGSELGMTAKKGETMASYRDRIKQRMNDARATA